MVRARRDAPQQLELDHCFINCRASPDRIDALYPVEGIQSSMAGLHRAGSHIIGQAGVEFMEIKERMKERKKEKKEKKTKNKTEIMTPSSIMLS
jgi:hypothetical protein